MASMNAVVLIGRLTKDPEARQPTQSGLSITKFSVAVDRKSGTKEDRKTDFFDVTAFSKTAEFVNNYLNKGDLVAVGGRVEINKVPAHDGNGTVTFVDVVANTVEKLSWDKDATDKVAGSESTATVPATSPAKPVDTLEAGPTDDDADPFADE